MTNTEPHAYPLKVYVAHCEECGWEDDETFDFEDEAEEACARHDEREHSGEGDTEPEETYQETLDRLAEAAIRNARSAA